jgi:hypothetical protein
MQCYKVQRGPKDYEMIIVDDVSDDRFEDWISLGLERVKPDYPVYVYSILEGYERLNVGRTLNVCAKKAHGDLFIFNPSDVMPMGRLVLNKIRDHHKANKRSYLTPRLLSSACEQLMDNDVGGGFVVPGGSISREFYEWLGGHDERYIGYGNSDSDWTGRIVYGHAKHGGSLIQNRHLLFMHLESAHLIRPGTRDRHEDLKKIVFENHPKGIYRVNPEGWGDCPTRRIV